MKESNFDLKNIRKHADELNSRDSAAKAPTIDIERFPAELSMLRQARLAAYGFYHAMSVSWVCQEPTHHQHFMRLFTNTEAKEDIRMNFHLLVNPQHKLKEKNPTIRENKNKMNLEKSALFTSPFGEVTEL